MSGTRAEVHVSGDVLGQLVVGDHNVVVTAEHSAVTVLAPADRPRPVRRERVELLPRRGSPLHGRDRELADIAASVADADAIQIHGDEGVGKSTVVRHAARRMAARGTGVVFPGGTGRDAGDLAQDLFEACYDCAGYRPSAVELRRLMAGVEICVVIDDLDCEGPELVALLDRAPDAAFVLASPGQSLWGAGRVLPLRGLGREDGRAVLADALGRPLLPAEAAPADALWEAVQGSPLALHRAAAFTLTGPEGVLARPGQVTALLPQVLDRLADTERALVTALAAGAAVSAELLAFLLGHPEESGGVGATVERLTSYGLLTASERGCRLTEGVAEALPEATETTAGLADRLTEWVATASPRAVADHGPLIAAVTGAATRAGRPDAGARLARAAAPSAALSLRWASWQRILDQGKAAAESARDNRLVAYFTHEKGVLSLLTGKRVAAAAALAAAGEIWLRLGHHGHAAVAQHAHALTGSAASHAAPAAAAQGAGAHAAGATHTASHAGAAGAKATAVKTGIGLTGKVAIGGGLAAVVAGGTVLGVRAATPPTVLTVKKGKQGPVAVRPSGPVPGGARFVYWGCLQAAPSPACTVRADAGSRYGEGRARRSSAPPRSVPMTPGPPSGHRTRGTPARRRRTSAPSGSSTARRW